MLTTILSILITILNNYQMRVSAMGTIENIRSLIAGTMVLTTLPLTNDQLMDIDYIINS